MRGLTSREPTRQVCHMDRRLVLKMLAAAPLSSVAPSYNSTAQILELSCTDLSAHICSGNLRAEMVCGQFLKQFERLRSLNAVICVDSASVLSRAREIDRARDKGARLPNLAGLPILIKDNIDTVGLPTSAGTPSLKQNYPPCNAPVVDRLLKQGAIVMGKANMHELALGITSSNPAFGFVRNPYDLDLIPGGSSGGSAAAVAARIAPAALGTDTGGSVRIPAAFCGIVGFRPSIRPRKLYSQRGVVPITHDMDTIGPMARSVADVALLHAMIVGQRPLRPGSLENTRIGVPRIGYWEDLDPDVDKIAQAALSRLRDAGAVLVEVNLRGIKNAAWDVVSAMVSGIIKDLGTFLREQMPSRSLNDLTNQVASQDVRAVLAAAATGAQSVADLVRMRDSVCAAYKTAFLKHEIHVIVFPTVVLPPPPIRATGDGPNDPIEFNGRMESEGLTTLRNTAPVAAFGAPALSFPVGLTSKGLPVALEIDGLPGGDDVVLAIAGAAEAVIGRIPPPRFIGASSAA